MANDITGFGSVINLVASTTFPAGLAITQLADDTDPADMASVKIANVDMGVNGDLIKFSRAAPLPLSISVIPGSEDDVNLEILAQANRASQGKQNARDTITLTIVYPDGSVYTFIDGAVTDGMFGKSISSAGRLKTRTYSFMFKDVKVS